VSGVAAILLAAGSGSRFGGGKLLAPFRGRPLLESVLDELVRAPVDEVVAVLGADTGRVREVCEARGARTTFNPDWERGMSTSVLVGLRACGPEVRAAVVVLGDQPLVGARAVERLVAAFEEGAGIVAATYGGEFRNPVLFAREAWPLLERELAGDRGARALLRRYPELVVGVPCDDVADPADIDTVEDLRRLEREATAGRRNSA
jgi:CTP:molybdopterin cytidylyltransferase MocA